MLVLKLIPAGVALIPKLAMAPPVELMVNPVATVLTVLVSDEEERVKAGAVVVAVTVRVNVRIAFPDVVVAVIV